MWRTQRARLRHLVRLYMDDFEILSQGFFFRIFQRCFCASFSAFCLPAVTELTFHFYFRVVSVFIFTLFCVSVLLAYFLISHGRPANLAKTASENLIKPGISLINISASGWLPGWPAEPASS